MKLRMYFIGTKNASRWNSSAHFYPWWWSHFQLYTTNRRTSCVTNTSLASIESNFILILVFEVEWTSRDRDFLGHDIGDQSTQKTVIMRKGHLLSYIISEDHDDCPYRNTGHRRSSHHPAEHIRPHRVVIIPDAKRGITNQSIYHDRLKHNNTWICRK